MLIGAGLVFLFTILILGGQHHELIFIDFEKEAKNVVLDKARFVEIKEINKGFQAVEKDYNKQIKSYAKEFSALLKNQSTTSQSFTHYLDEVVKYEEESGGKYIEIREKVKDQMTEEEWSQMMDNLTKEIDKNGDKTGKALEKYNKQMAGFSQSILNSLDNIDSQVALKPVLNDFTTNASRLAELMLVYDVKEMEVLSSYKSSKEDVAQVLNNYNIEMQEFYNLVFKLHVEIAKTISVKEWSQLSKELNNI